MKLSGGFETSNTSDSPDVFCQQLRLAEEIESRGKPTSFFWWQAFKVTTISRHSKFVFVLFFWWLFFLFSNKKKYSFWRQKIDSIFKVRIRANLCAALHRGFFGEHWRLRYSVHVLRDKACWVANKSFEFSKFTFKLLRAWLYFLGRLKNVFLFTLSYIFIFFGFHEIAYPQLAKKE